MTNAVRTVQQPNRQREQQAAVAFLKAVLRAGPVRVDDVWARARAASIAKLYVRQAKQHLKVENVKSGFGREGYWSWRLPA